ncbi:hypothetical protein ACJ7K1_05845 [Paenibacillus elgii]
MAYTGKTDWKYDEVVTEGDMNRIEKGVVDAHTQIEGVQVTMAQEIDKVNRAVDGIREDHTKPLIIEVRTSDPLGPEIGRMWLRSDL